MMMTFGVEMIRHKMILLKFWAGQPKPYWRIDCEEQLAKLYPEAQIIDYTCDDILYTDRWRIEQLSKQPNTLWVDNDIWLDEPIKLTDLPGMIWEYGCPHWSIIWNGKRPELFVNETVNSLSNKIMQLCQIGEADLYTIKGQHWATDRNGNRVHRKDNLIYNLPFVK